MSKITEGSDLPRGSIRDINTFLDTLRDTEGGNLVGCYRDLFGHPPPATRDRNWLFYNCAYKYQEKYYFKKRIPDEVQAKAESWYHKPTPEMLMVETIGKLKVAELKDLCKKHDITWDGKKRKEIVKKLAWSECGEVPVEERSATSPKKGRGKRGRRKLPDNLPNEIKELLEMKTGADKEMQRKIRRKLRSIDPDWRSKYGG